VHILKSKKWSILENSRIWRIKNPTVDRMNLLVQAPNKEELEEYFIPPQILDCNDNGKSKKIGRISFHIGRYCKMGDWMS